MDVCIHARKDTCTHMHITSCRHALFELYICLNIALLVKTKLESVVFNDDLVSHGCHPPCCSLKEGEYMKVPDAPPCVGREEVTPLPDDIYTKAVSLTDGSFLTLVITLIITYLYRYNYCKWQKKTIGNWQMYPYSFTNLVNMWANCIDAYAITELSNSEFMFLTDCVDLSVALLLMYCTWWFPNCWNISKMLEYFQNVNFSILLYQYLKRSCSFELIVFMFCYISSVNGASNGGMF